MFNSTLPDVQRKCVSSLLLFYKKDDNIIKKNEEIRRKMGGIKGSTILRALRVEINQSSTLTHFFSSS